MRTRLMTAWVMLLIVLGAREIAAQSNDVERDSATRVTPAAESEEVGTVTRWRARYAALNEKGLSFTVGSILPGSKLSAGFELGRDRILGTPLGASFAAEWSVRGYQQYDVRVGKMKGRNRRAELRPVDVDLSSMHNDNSLLAFGTSLFVHVRQRVYPRMDFFGLGQRTDFAGRSDYKIAGPSIDVVAQWQRDKHFGIAGRYGKLDLSLGDPTNDGVPNVETIYTPATAPGVDVERQYQVGGVAATLDFRDRPRLTSKGTFAAVGIWHAMPDDVDDDRSNWMRLVADVRHFVPVRSENHVIALRLLFSSRLGAVHTATPFYLQPTLGGSKTLRGFRSHRLRGDAVWATNAEYRWRPHKWVEIAPFLDLGAVAPRFGELGSAHLEVSPGIGFRATADSLVIGRIDVAHSRDGIRVLLAVSAPF